MNWTRRAFLRAALVAMASGLLPVPRRPSWQTVGDPRARHGYMSIGLRVDADGNFAGGAEAWVVPPDDESFPVPVARYGAHPEQLVAEFLAEQAIDVRHVGVLIRDEDGVLVKERWHRGASLAPGDTLQATVT